MAIGSWKGNCALERWTANSQSLVLAPALGAMLLLGLTQGVSAQAALESARSPFVEAVAPRSNSPAWFNLKPPGPEADPIKGVIEVLDVDLPAQPATFGAGPRDPLLSGAALKRDLRTIVGFSLGSRARGDYLWGRVTGRPGFDNTVAWALEELKKAGLRDAHLETFTSAPINLPVSGEVRLVASPAFGLGSEDIVLQSAMVGGNGPVNGEVTAPLIYVGQATLADLAGRDVKGKIAVINATPNPGLYSTNEYGRLQAMMKAGAAGAIEILEQAGNMKSYDRDRHGCGMGLCFTIGGEDGYYLQNVLGAAAEAGHPVMARLSAKSEVINDYHLPNVVATIPGRTDRFLLINAHADAWFTGADDNGGGLATLVALARHFARQPKPERTLVFIASAGHHTAANGLAAFRAVHDKDYVARADMILNLEHVAVSGMVRSMARSQDQNFGRVMVATTTEWPKHVGVSNRAPFIMDLWRQGAVCFGLNTQRVIDRRNPGELGRFAELSVAQTEMISVGPVYHTSGETVNTVPDEGLERSARFHAYLVDASDKAPAALLNGAAWTPRTRCPPTP